MREKLEQKIAVLFMIPSFSHAEMLSGQLGSEEWKNTVKKVQYSTLADNLISKCDDEKRPVSVLVSDVCLF